MPLLKEGIDTMEAWGFKYKTIGFSWAKFNKNGKPFFGVGAYAKSNVELCLMGVRGKVGRLIKGQTSDPKTKLTVASNYVSSLILTNRPHQSTKVFFHSSKPEEQYSRIEGLFGDVSRIELFARNTRNGWDSIGHDIDGADIRNYLVS
jgi:N6-adenosine-specific RNA methylase IME4